MNRLTQHFISLVLLTLLLAGCGGGAPADTDPDPDPEESGITVSGKLLFPNGSAASEMAVVVSGQATTTDASGAFQVENVEAPYEVAAHYDTLNVVVAYQGLTVEEPVLVLLDPTPEAERQATITFTAYSFDAAPPPPPPHNSNDDAAVCSGPVDFHFCSGRALARSTPSVRTVQWRGPASTPARIAAVQGTVLGVRPRMFTSYSHFASRSMNFVDGEDGSYSITYARVSTGSITGTTTAPAGYTVTHRGLGLMTGDEVWGVISYEADSVASPIQTAFELATPMASGFSYYVTATAEQGEASVTRRVPVANANAADVTIELPTPPQLLQPANGQVGLSQNALFKWTAVEDAAYVHTLITATPGSPSYLIVTTDPEARLPDVSVIDVSLPSADTYTWGVRAIAPVASMDALAAGIYFETVGDTWATSARRTFTTAP